MSITNKLLSAPGGWTYPYSIENSCIFDGASDYLEMTPGSSGDRKTYTFSFWCKRVVLGTTQYVFSILYDTNNIQWIALDSNDRLGWNDLYGGSYDCQKNTNQRFRDTGSWYHFVVAVDCANTSLKMYVNGEEVTDFVTDNDPSDHPTMVNYTATHCIGRYVGYDLYYFNGYLAEFNFIDGQALTPDSFGQTYNGVWVPKQYTVTYGTNGYYLDFSNASDLGADANGSNDWTENGITSDNQTTDSPTNNRSILNVLQCSTVAKIQDGALILSQTSTTAQWAAGTIQYPSSGVWAFEAIPSRNISDNIIGISTNDWTNANHLTSASVGQATGSMGYRNNGNFEDEGSAGAYGDTYTTSDVIGVVVDSDNGTLTFYKNGVSQGTAKTGLTASDWFPTISSKNSDTAVVFDEDSFTYTYGNAKGLKAKNLPDPGSKYYQGNVAFDDITWSGDDAYPRDIGGLEFQPDIIWTKTRDQTYDHTFMTSNMDATYYVEPSTNDMKAVKDDGIVAITSDGFTVGDNDSVWVRLNSSSYTYIAWCWKKDPNYGIDLVTYEGTGVAHSIAHNLNAVPEAIWVKNLDATNSWLNYHVSVGETKGYWFNSVNAPAVTSAYWNDTAPTSTHFTVGTNAAVNGNTNTIVACLFAPVEGFSKFGTYKSNNSDDGPFIYCGFRPKLVILKNTSTNYAWMIVSDGHNEYNVADNSFTIAGAIETVDSAAKQLDLLSNGFKCRDQSGSHNNSTNNISYMAFAECPFKIANAK
jgi:hypothetical protein